jgi:hypothetical protein
MGFGQPDQEGHVIHDRETGKLRIVNFGRTAWEGIVQQPHVRTHESLIEMLVGAGFKRTGFRRDFARAYFSDLKLPSDVCATRCWCSFAMKQHLGKLLEIDEYKGCVWEYVREYEGYWETFDMLPDAWLVLPEHDLLVVVEVDVTHHHERERYSEVWWWLDSESWSLCELHVDRHGNACSPRDHAGIWFDLHSPTPPPPPTPPPTTPTTPPQSQAPTPPRHLPRGCFEWRGRIRAG